jgi:RNA polymerase sigma factor (sigma-70 family)
LTDTSSLEAAVADLLPRARRGERDAMDGLLRHCRRTVFRWAVAQTGDQADAEDVTQEVLIRVHSSLHRFAGRSRFTTWLYQVTRHEASNLRRRVWRRLRLIDEVAREPARAAPGDPVERLHADAVAAETRALLWRLPRRQREVFTLADLEGCPLGEIAERLGTSPVTVRVHLLHARRTLRAAILERWPALREERA